MLMISNSLRDELPLTPSFIEALSSHRSKPALHLLNECGSTHLDFKMPCVRTLHTSVNAVSAFLRPQRKLNLRDVFIKCPSLKDLSVNVSNLQREPMRSTPRYRTVQIVEHLVLDPNETMPPIESLRLSGYNAGGQEWDYWRTKFPWDKLKSLTLGPEETLNFIRLAIGYARNLRCLAVSAYSRPHLERCPDLEELLVSFDTLRHLEVKGYFPSIAAVVNHRDLTSLTLHTIERPTRQRSILKLEDVRYLDEYCPKLETLEIDLRHVGGWVSRLIVSPSWNDTNVILLAGGYCRCVSKRLQKPPSPVHPRRVRNPEDGRALAGCIVRDAWSGTDSD